MKTLVVCGPTASGKTGFAVSLARLIGAEIISADCMLVYKRLNIGTAKPAKEEMGGIVHHMIDVAEPTESFSVSDYAKGAEKALDLVQKRGNRSIICGGTGFYIQSLLFTRNLGGVPADSHIREKYEALANEKGKEYVHSLLEKVDPESAALLHPNDFKRVVRALEIYELSGKKKSEQKDGFQAKRDYIAVALDWPRDQLYERINRRVDVMLKEGLVDEVESLLNSGVSKSSQSMQGIGYKEVVDFLKNRISYSTMTDIIKQNTRNYAKRQITFFKKLPGLIWLDAHDERKIEKVMEMIV